jgi:hypothetical protein
MALGQVQPLTTPAVEQVLAVVLLVLPQKQAQAMLVMQLVEEQMRMTSMAGERCFEPVQFLSLTARSGKLRPA